MRDEGRMTMYEKRKTQNAKVKTKTQSSKT